MNKVTLRSIRAGRPREVVLSDQSLVEIRPWRDSSSTFAVVTPRSGFEVALAGWTTANRGMVDELLLKHRALLFRGFAVDTAQRFAESVASFAKGVVMDAPRDESTPRAEAGARKVFASTFYPAHQTIDMHNEAAYCLAWPERILFCCLTAPTSGGETPIADVRRVLERIPQEIQRRFEERGVFYVRNYNAGLGLTWQRAFYTEDRAVLEAYCREHDIAVEWRGSGRLRTTSRRPAFQKHPVTGERLWFNHAAFFHLSAQRAEVQQLVGAFGTDQAPFSTMYGDGSPIDPEDVRVILDAYNAEKVLFPWQRGDVLLLDNMTFAHGREPFEGDREVVVSLTDPHSST